MTRLLSFSAQGATFFFYFVYIDVAMCDLVHDVETVHGLCYETAKVQFSRHHSYVRKDFKMMLTNVKYSLHIMHLVTFASKFHLTKTAHKPITVFVPFSAHALISALPPISELKLI